MRVQPLLLLRRVELRLPLRGLRVVALARFCSMPSGVEVDERLHAFERVFVRRAAILGREVDRVSLEEVRLGELVLGAAPPRGPPSAAFPGRTAPRPSAARTASRRASRHRRACRRPAPPPPAPGSCRAESRSRRPTACALCRSSLHRSPREACTGRSRHRGGRRRRRWRVDRVEVPRGRRNRKHPARVRNTTRPAVAGRRALWVVQQADFALRQASGSSADRPRSAWPRGLSRP
jgi:hypothetical protein